MNINSISKTIAKKLVDGGADPKLEKIYAYGIEGILTTGIILLILFTAGLLLGKLPHMIVFIVAWLPLRILVGGIHANTHLMCTIISVALGIISVLLTKQLNAIPFYAIAITAAVCYIIFFTLSPVVHKNHPISNAHRRKMRVAARVFAVIECGCIVALAYFKLEAMAPALMACALTAVMEVMGWLSKDAIREYE